VSSNSDPATVLVVEDERHLADLYTDYLKDQYKVATAYGGQEGVELLSESVDVVLLDRRMPVVSGSEVVAAIEERNLECRIAMVTAVDPDFDIIDMKVDDYVVKPVSKSTLREVVDRLLTISEYSERLQELTSKKLKRNVLTVEKSAPELETNERFQRLEAEIDDLEAELESLAMDLDEEDLTRYV
jgi:DNA-binding response OmpR family regulator